MDRRLRKRVWERAAACCEYCRMPQDYIDAPHEIDHVIAEKHAGTTEDGNLALACFACNNHKGPNIAGINSESGEIVRLFHPRQDRWDEHFSWNGALLSGLTPIGRATIQVLAINARHRVVHRQALIVEGVFPPPQPGASVSG